MRKYLSYVLVGLFACVAVAAMTPAGGTALAWLLKPAAESRVTALRFALRLPGAFEPCSLRDSYRAAVREVRQVERRDQIVGDSQLIQRDGNLERWKTDAGEYWIASGDTVSAFHVIAEQEWSDSPRVHAGDIVIDCGAHYGIWARRALAAGAGMVVAVEPAPETAECLRRNLAGEIKAGRVVVVEKGVWDRPGSMQMTIMPGFGADNTLVLPHGEGRNVDVALSPLDQIVSELNLPRVDLIKMDVEGAEKQALAGSAKTIARFRPTLSISVYHLPDDLERIPALIRAFEPKYHASYGVCRESGARYTPELAHFDAR